MQKSLITYIFTQMQTRSTHYHILLFLRFLVLGVTFGPARMEQGDFSFFTSTRAPFALLLYLFLRISPFFGQVSFQCFIALWHKYYLCWASNFLVIFPFCMTFLGLTAVSLICSVFLFSSCRGCPCFPMDSCLNWRGGGEVLQLCCPRGCHRHAVVSLVLSRSAGLLRSRAALTFSLGIPSISIVRSLLSNPTL